MVLENQVRIKHIYLHLHIGFPVYIADVSTDTAYSVQGLDGIGLLVNKYTDP